MQAAPLDGKIALIVGASRGIGAATARAFVESGARVILASRDIDALEALAGELGGPAHARAIKLDIRNSAEIVEAVRFAADAFGRLDIAFNNAGISPKLARFADLEEEAFDATLAVNLRAVFVAMKHQIRVMRLGGGGSIVVTGSVGSLVGLPQMGAYVASKHALAGLVKTAALDHAKDNIRVNLIAPGTVMTEMLKAGIGATEEGLSRLAAASPMARIASPEEIAGSVVWLSSPAASYITGAIIPVDGGYTVG
jgi:NAD(P)-dependent dehydrogenase (short-subunit alcohol dehydrogenase family)